MYATTGDVDGASPRGRRNLGKTLIASITSGRISAGAEEPISRWASSTTGRAHLRGGGGTEHRHRAAEGVQGASPRGRRNPARRAPQPARPGRISAGAEEPTRRAERQRERGAHLRGGGGTAPRSEPSARRCGASPRGRRNPVQVRGSAPAPGRISAGAEEPAAQRWIMSWAGAHLRGGGGTHGGSQQLQRCQGASPRGRRNRLATSIGSWRKRRISAGAEEPS